MEKKRKEKKSRDQNLSNMRNEELKDYIYIHILKQFLIYVLIIRKTLLHKEYRKSATLSTTFPLITQQHKK